MQFRLACSQRAGLRRRHGDKGQGLQGRACRSKDSCLFWLGGGEDARLERQHNTIFVSKRCPQQLLGHDEIRNGRVDAPGSLATPAEGATSS